MPTENAISPQVLADSLNIERRYLAEVLERAARLAGRSVAADLRHFQAAARGSIEGFTFPGELLPINPFGGMVQQIAARPRKWRSILLQPAPNMPTG